ncbi:hypothetical protein ACTFIU_008984 [Dictyostelium citrinum]
MLYGRDLGLVHHHPHWIIPNWLFQRILDQLNRQRIQYNISILGPSQHTVNSYHQLIQRLDIQAYLIKQNNSISRFLISNISKYYQDLWSRLSFASAMALQSGAMCFNHWNNN